MIKAIYDLDMTPMRTLPIIINVSQYDDLGRTLVFNLFSSSGKWTAPTSAAVTFEGGKPDGKFFAYNCAYSNGTVTVTIQQQMTAVAGKVRCKIKVTSGDKVVESAPIIMIVDAAAVPDGSDMSKSDINDAIANVTQKIVDQVKDNIPSDYSQLSTDVSSLKQDIDYKIGKAAIGEKELKFTNIGYVKAADGEIISTANAQNTGFCRIDGVSRIIAHVNLSEEGAKIAFFSRNKEYLKDISIISTGSGYAEIDLDITSDDYVNAKYCIISNYGFEPKIAKVIGAVAPYSVKVTAEEAKVTAEEAITPYKTTFFEELNIGTPENVKNVPRYPNSNGLVSAISNGWSLIFKCKPSTDYYIYIPDRNRRNAAESENGEFVDGETYTILPTSVINYSGVDVVKITTGENAKRIMFYYFNGSYDYDTNRDKIIILENKWTPDPYAHISKQYLPKEIVKQSKHYGTFSIIGDSYSSFKGYMANANAATWYPASDHNMNDTNDVENVEQTWWYKFANSYECRLIENNSWSGSTIAYDGYSEGLEDGKETSFIQRMSLLTTPQLILIYGGTNDSWVAGDTNREDFLGDYKYSDFLESDFIYFRPALAYLLDKLKHRHIGAKIIFMLNASLSNIKESVHEICAHYEIGVCEITDIALAHSHPTGEGMTTIAKQIIAFLED